MTLPYFVLGKCPAKEGKINNIDFIKVKNLGSFLLLVKVGMFTDHVRVFTDHYRSLTKFFTHKTIAVFQCRALHKKVDPNYSKIICISYFI